MSLISIWYVLLQSKKQQIISVPQLCKYKSPKKMKNLRKGLFIALNSTLVVGRFPKFPPVLLWYISVLFAAVKSDIPSPVSSLNVSQIHESSRRDLKCLQGGTPIFSGIEHRHWMCQGREWIIFAFTKNIGEAPSGIQNASFGHQSLQRWTEIQERKTARRMKEMKSTPYEQR